jgi:hypothetical protein
MTLKMNDSHMVTLAQIKEFAKLEMSPNLAIQSKEEMYSWINDVLNRFQYFRIKKEKKE